MEDTQIQIDATAWPSSYNRKSKRVDLEKFFQQVQQECQQIEQETTEQKPKHKVVRFSTEPPTVFTYEPEYDLFERLKSSMEQSKDSWPTYARKPRKLDLRPIVNNQYSGQSPVSAPCSFSTTSSSPISSSASSLSSNNNNNTPLVSSNNHRSYSLPTTPTRSLSNNHSHNSAVSSSPYLSSSTTTNNNNNNNNKINSPPLSPNLPNLTTSDDSSDEDDQPSPTLTLTPTNSSLPFSSTSFTKRITAVFSRKKSIGKKNNSQ
ncbi:hypothetical protein BJ944DRAFT_274334 [Cunninghamella echinulata]|nr:hypothetical protein BJ944DRAFT_274334 [Cunninghamella echinulata]